MDSSSMSSGPVAPVPPAVLEVGASRRRRTTRAILAVVALLGAAALPAAYAGKPGGGGSAAPAGTIAFAHNFEASVFTIRPDGTALTTLAVTECVAPWRSGDPMSFGGAHAASHLRHGGKLWYVRVCSPTDGPATYPNGNARRELFLVREDNYTVQLTDNPLLAPVDTSHPDFSVNDNSVQFGGYRWVEDGAGGWTVGESGVYAARLDWTDVENPVLVDVPVLVAPVPTFQGANGVIRVQVSPPQRSADGRTVVFAYTNPSAITVVDTVDGTTRPVATGYRPRLSPLGTKIAYEANDGIRVVNVDGTGNVLVIAGNSSSATLSGTQVTSPVWSPDSTHIAFRFTKYRSQPGSATRSLQYATATANASAKTVPNATDVGVVQSWLP